MYNTKRAVPRHRKQSARSADRQERAIERRMRQAVKRMLRTVAK